MPSPMAILAALTLLAQAQGIQPAEDAYAEAVRLLAQDRASEAEAAARRALAESSLFLPEREIEETPEKGVVFDEMIEKARSSYRERRARYFQAFGLALTAEERWKEARKALRRSAGLRPAAEVFTTVASHPDLPIEERVSALIQAYFSRGADRSAIESELLESGAFASAEALEAVFDRERFARELAGQFPDVEIQVAPLPDVRVATSTSTFVAADWLNEGAVVVMYLPVAGCNRCSEELDGIRRGLGDWNRRGETEFVTAAFVDEQDLEDARRIVRLLGMPVEVGRADRLPAGIASASGGEIVMVALLGLMQVHIPLDGEAPSRVIGEQVAAVAQLLQEQEPAGESRRVVAGGGSESGRNALESLVDRAVPLEAGPVPIPDVYEAIDREARRLLDDGAREDAISILGELARLRGAGRAKARALSVLDSALPEKVLAAVKEVAPEAQRQAPPEDGAYYVALSNRPRRQVLLQRTFIEGDALGHFDLILAWGDAGVAPTWVGRSPARPSGVRFASAGAVFFFSKETCRGLRLVGEAVVLQEGCPADVEENMFVESIDALVDPVPQRVAPRFYRRIPMNPSQPALAETSLEQGLRLFRDGDYRQAIAKFEQASKEIDPVAPYDETDLRYNTARCYQELGEGPRALRIMESIGDAAYQDVVEERIDELAVATRR